MKKNNISFFLFLTLICIQFFAYSQQIQVSTKNRRASAEFYKALDFYNKYEYLRAEQGFLKAIELDAKFVEAHQLLATVYEETKQFEKAIEHYEQVLQIKPSFFPNNYLLVGNLSMKAGEYEKALTHYTAYSKLPAQDVSVALQQESLISIEKAKFAINLKNNPVPFYPINLGANINSSNSEYSPTLTADEQTLYFTVARPRDQYTLCDNCKEEEDFYISKQIDGEWSIALPLGHPINTRGNEGAASISPDGMYFYFTACNRDDGFGSCDLYVSKREKGKWSKPTNMGSTVNSKNWDSHPSIAPDGKTLYFTSARNGNMDIYVSELDENGNWSEPQNIGKPINTNKTEMSPFIHPDGKTLYFASDGHFGMGGLDLFFSRKQEDGSWSEPQNLGYPINTHHDEGFFIVNALGNMAYFSSNKFGGYGKLDLFCFELPEEVRPTPVTYLKGIVLEAETNKKLSANFELFDLETGKLVVRSVSDEADGSFIVSLPISKNYALHVSKEGYLFHSENFALDENINKIGTYEKNVILQAIKTGEVVVLRNIFFDFDKETLKEESMLELEKLLNLLKNNSNMSVEIRGHTDNIGSAEYNKVLSEKRALSVYTYLIKHGIDTQRLKYKGYGLSIPIDTNETEEGRANNRRTEFKVLGF